MITFTLAGPPVAKGRARFARRGSNVVTFTPDKTQKHEHAIGYAAKVAAMGRTLEGPLSLEVVFGVPIPSSWPRWKRLEAAQGTLSPTGRSDLDNYLKCVLDGLNGVIWKDDAQVVHLIAEKRYSEEPFTSVRVAEWKSSISQTANTSGPPSPYLPIPPTF